MTRTLYNGATSSDRHYVARDAGTHEPAIGRLPFREAETLRAWVDRVVAYETAPPVHPTRRLMRFITSEGRFGGPIDGMIESRFRGILARDVPQAYDVEVTYANPTSPFLWPPPEMAAKVVAGMNDGALFYTYVGHGFEKGFDTLQVGGRRHRILHVDDVDQVDAQAMPPVVFVLACTTAMFDGVRGDGIGEALMKRPHGPVAYWGASRICHPLYNAFVGEAIARRLGRSEGRPRLGDLLAAASEDAPRRYAALHPLMRGPLDWFMRSLGIERIGPLFEEGAAMYTLLGDPALEIALPRTDLAVEAHWTAADRIVTARIQGPIGDDTTVHLALEVPRDRDLHPVEPVADPADPASFPTIRQNHGLANERAITRRDVAYGGGGIEVAFEVPADIEAEGLVVKAWAVTEDDVHQGAAVLGPAKEDSAVPR